MIAQFIIGFTLQVVGYFLQSAAAAKAAKERKPKASDFKEPKAEPGRAIPIIAGTVIVKDPQILLSAEKNMTNRWIKMKQK